MRLGVGRLLLAIASVLMRMRGDAFAADLLAFAFVANATFCLCYSRELPRVRPISSFLTLRRSTRPSDVARFRSD